MTDRLHSNYMRNEGYAYTSGIGRECNGQRVLEHLASVYAHSSAAR